VGHVLEPSYNHWSMRRTRPLIRLLRRRGRVVVRWLSSSLFIGLVLGLASSVIVERIKILFSEHDLAAIEVNATQRTVADFGALQVLRNGSIVEQRRFRDYDRASINLALTPGAYDIRARVLTRQLSLVSKQFARSSRSAYTDARLPPITFFSDDEFVRIPSGQFRQGSDRFPEASPTHDVTLHAFSIRSIPVTSCEYATYQSAQNDASVDDVAICSGNDASKPAVWMAWAGAKDFCRWLSSWKRQKYRLPTEAEYERAMRILGNGQEYPWGNREFDPEKIGTAKANY